jgi:hypothetical protein
LVSIRSKMSLMRYGVNLLNKIINIKFKRIFLKAYYSLKYVAFVINNLSESI